MKNHARLTKQLNRKKPESIGLNKSLWHRKYTQHTLGDYSSVVTEAPRRVLQRTN
jgi:hypothetical protein